MKKSLLLLSLVSSALLADATPTNPFDSQEKRYPYFKPTENNPIIYDQNLSPYMGAYDILGTYKGLEKGVNFILGEGAPKTDWLSRLGRFVELTGFWWPVGYMGATAQHEVFGHGFRVRELGSRAEVDHYSFNLPMPYGWGGAETLFAYDFDVSPMEMATISIGGMEASAVLAHRVAMNWLSRGIIDPKETYLYSAAQNDISNYIAYTLIENKKDDYSVKVILDQWTDHTNTPLSGNDVQGYQFFLSRIYPGSEISRNALRNGAIANVALNPFTYLNMYSIWKYVAKGEMARMPMIPVGKSFRFLPSYRYAFAPYGPENYVESYMRIKEDMPLFAYVRGGSYAGNRYYGLGGQIPSLIKRGAHSIGVGVDLWHQPQLLLDNATYSAADYQIAAEEYEETPLYANYYYNRADSKVDQEIDDSEKRAAYEKMTAPAGYSYEELHKKMFGASFTATYEYTLGATSLFLQTGYKTKGFVQGMSLKAAPIIRIGATAKF